MKIGISTGCLYPMLTEESLFSLTEIGFGSFEIFVSAYSELEPSYLNLLNEKLGKYNASVSSIHPFTSSYESFLLFSGYERRFLDGIQFYENYFRAAKRLGAKKVILHGIHNDFSKAITETEYCRRFSLLSDRASEYGIDLLQENVFLHKSGNIDFIRKMRELIPERAKFTCDTKQSKRCGYSPEEIALTMSEGLHHIHISDYTPDGKCVLPGKGCMDYAAFFSALKSVGYDGDIIIEVYRSSFGKPEELIKARDFLGRFI